jgi:shikimate kinase
MGSDRSILLCGPMGSGKSSVGRALAAALGWRFADTDADVEASAGLSIAQLFEREGEAGFRARERAALRGLPEARCVAALGGGAVEARENREILRAKGRLVWLDARPETLARRIGADPARPLLAGLDAAGRVERLGELCARRAHAYASAELRVVTDDKDVGEVCRAVLDGLGLEARRADGR